MGMMLVYGARIGLVHATQDYSSLDYASRYGFNANTFRDYENASEDEIFDALAKNATQYFSTDKAFQNGVKETTLFEIICQNAPL
jgi:hypothetical protein